MNFASRGDVVVFVLCLLFGGGVLFAYCIKQFDKPTESRNDADPWPFIVPKYLASRQRYLTGFSLYFAILAAIFVFFSLLGPQIVGGVFTAIASAQSLSNAAAPAAAPVANLSWTINPTFPIVIAFWLIGLNPNLPRFLDVELAIRKIGHRTAYIPKGMNDIFVFMRYAGYADFAMPERELKEVWNEIGVRPVRSDQDELKPVIELINRVALLYGRAATLAGDLNLPLAPALKDGININVFRSYRADIGRVLTMLQAAHGRIVEQISAPQDDHSQAVQEIQRDLNRGLEFIFTLFACAITAKGTEHLADRLRNFGITKPYPPKPQIPWNPILKVTLSCGIILFAGWWFASRALLPNSEAARNAGIPTSDREMAVWLLFAIIVHFLAIALATRMRMRLIDRDNYLSPTGSTDISAYAKIFGGCFVASFGFYFVTTSVSLVAIVQDTWGAPISIMLDALSGWAMFCLVWAFVPASCGLMTAYTLDRPSDTVVQRAQSGGIEALTLAILAVLAIQFSGQESTTLFRLFNALVYGGIGFVFGFMLPVAITRHRRALETRLPEKIVMLRSAVFQNFLDMEDFNRWLQGSEAKLDGKRPLDVLEDDSGLQRLIDFVRTSRALPAGA